MVAREGLGTLDYELLANPEHIQAVSGLVTAVIYQDVITIKQYALHAVACHFDNRERFRVGTQVDTNPIFPKGHWMPTRQRNRAKPKGRLKAAKPTAKQPPNRKNAAKPSRPDRNCR